MNAEELLKMLEHMRDDPGLPELSQYRLADESGSLITGIWTDHDKRKVTMVVPSRHSRTRVDL